jgi:hypothetical protein
LARATGGWWHEEEIGFTRRGKVWWGGCEGQSDRLRILLCVTASPDHSEIHLAH